MSKKHLGIFTLSYFVFIFASMSVTISHLVYGCLSSYDLGIFSEALQSAWRGQSDPFIPLREAYLTQDHWDPITLVVGYLSVPLSGLVSAPRFLLWFESSVLYVSAVLLFTALDRRGFSKQRSWLGFVSVCFASTIWNAIS